MAHPGRIPQYPSAGEPVIAFRHLVLLGLLCLSASVHAGQPLPLGALVHDAETGRLLYRETRLAVIAENQLQQLEIAAKAASGEELARRSLVLADAPWQPQIDYVEVSGAQISLERRDSRSWYLSRRSAEQGRTVKSWPQLGPQVVMADMLGSYLSRHREDIVAGRADRVAVFYLQTGKIRSLRLQSESFATGRGEMLRIHLLSTRLFGGDQRFASYELERDSGRLWRYTGPALCPCAGEFPRQVSVDFTY